MSCNCDKHPDGMGAGLTFLATCFGMIVMGFVMLAGCVYIVDSMSGKGKGQIEQIETDEEFY